MARTKSFYVPREETTRTESITTKTGAKITVACHKTGRMVEVARTQGFKETPEERAARLKGPRSARFDSKKAKGGRQGAKRAAIREH